MKHYFKIIFSFLFFISIHFSSLAQDKPKNLLEGVSMSGLWYLTHRTSHVENNEWENKFIVKRSYFTLKKKINNVYSVRCTQDITIDKEGHDAGNVETRMKYLFLKVKPQWNTFVSNPFIEIGMVHRPWLMYEQKVNEYRVQGNMHIERIGLYNSAGFGLLFGGSIGPKMDEEYLKNVNGTMKGKYASFAIGLYNGGGYAQFENNSNKVFEGIIIFRPLAYLIPEIQISHAFNIGKGNTEHSPAFNQFLFHGGYIGKNIILTGQYNFGRGDYKGKYVYDSFPDISLKNHGYSFFGEYKFENLPFALFTRFDCFTIPSDIEKNVKRQIAGLKYTIYKEISLILTGENVEYEFKDDELIFDINMQISF